MTYIKHLIATIALSSSLMVPAFAHACGEYNHDYGDGGIIQTPVSAKGRFLFVTKISRRRLKEAVAQHQQPVRPVLPREQI